LGLPLPEHSILMHIQNWLGFKVGWQSVNLYIALFPVSIDHMESMSFAAFSNTAKAASLLPAFPPCASCEPRFAVDRVVKQAILDPSILSYPIDRSVSILSVPNPWILSGWDPPHVSPQSTPPLQPRESSLPPTHPSWSVPALIPSSSPIHPSGDILHNHHWYLAIEMSVTLFCRGRPFTPFRVT